MTEASKFRGLVRNVRFELPRCLVSILWFCCGIAEPWGKATKPLIFPECVARVPEVWGLKVLSFETVRNGSQPSAVVPCEVATAVPLGTAAKAVTFGGFNRRVTSFLVAGVALSDIACFITCQKSLCVTGAGLWRPPLSFLCCVFFANFIVRAASNGDTVHIPWQAWHFVTWKPRTKHLF